MLNKGISVSPSLNPSLQRENFQSTKKYNKKRLLRLSIYAILIALCISVIAKLLIYLIDLITNISFFGEVSIANQNPSTDVFGWFIIFIPAIGGLIVGLMALYGSKGIRGHGIPEAMEQILTNKSKINPVITYLKPVSSAIVIGTGGPFGAEGPIIATGGALGSTFGQLLQITPNERKILLASGATAGMAAIFGAPIASILLAIELLLFEFSPRSFIPVALACITGAAGYHIFFRDTPIFFMDFDLMNPTSYGLIFYAAMGIVMGLFAIASTKIVYWIEDMFEKLPIHWAWWPAIGGLIVGIIGFYNPRTLGVGYYNISQILSGSLTLQVIVSLCVLKFISWSIALSSGTSGGTLAPLFTIGGALGVMLGMLGKAWFPEIGISIPMAALLGMATMFAGSSRAFLTSIVFAMETTGQETALLPLLAACTTAYIISYFFMDNTIMTEKIARRGVITPSSYEADVLSEIKVKQATTEKGLAISKDMKIGEARSWFEQETDLKTSYFIIGDEEGGYVGLISSTTLYSAHHSPDKQVGELVKRRNLFVHPDETLKMAVEKMAKENVDILPVISGDKIEGVLSYQDIFRVYKHGAENEEHRQAAISLNKRRIRLLVQGQKLVSIFRPKNKNNL